MYSLNTVNILLVGAASLLSSSPTLSFRLAFSELSESCTHRRLVIKRFAATENQHQSTSGSSFLTTRNKQFDEISSCSMAQLHASANSHNYFDDEFYNDYGNMHKIEHNPRLSSSLYPDEADFSNTFDNNDIYDDIQQRVILNMSPQSYNDMSKFSTLFRPMNPYDRQQPPQYQNTVYETSTSNNDESLYNEVFENDSCTDEECDLECDIPQEYKEFAKDNPIDVMSYLGIKRANSIDLSGP